ncbi:GNAT family N-acetyltransferase [Agromyces aurantiacus]|uniref:GNAT family N-acetyltransferase n=1 Tax=Agromyces aurantiacus TaxID=165814 RepID=A0ABV9R5S1_9MICO|nr:GNAT family N-acetyltransferase [Agromyces aurantiacus]MBM7503979.1 ribosomal protein S18 acetylase RimI-like enzyme [Agromyces aurantiacus]
MTDAAGPSAIRPYHAGDRDAIARICLLTAAGGGDATGVYSDDALMPEVYALPYVDFAPELAFVVDDGGRIGGYVLGVADTAAFIDWWTREWAPGFRARHPSPGPPTAHRPAYTEAQLIVDGGDPARMRIPELDRYPAHLHIDLLPEYQGRGLGRRLIDTLRAALAERGVPAVHLGMDPANTRARAFYERLGFHELPSSRVDAPRLGIATR